MAHTEDMGSQQAHLLLFRGCTLTVKSTNWWPLLGKCLQKATHPSAVWLVTAPLWCKGRSVRETVGCFCPRRFPLSSWPTTCLPSVQHLNLIMHRIHKFIKTLFPSRYYTDMSIQIEWFYVLILCYGLTKEKCHIQSVHSKRLTSHSQGSTSAKTIA